MFLTALTLDDLMHGVLQELIDRPFSVTSSRSAEHGPSSEIMAAMLHLQNPRCRLNRAETKGTVFSALGELLWYLSGHNDVSFITHYIDQYEKEKESEDATTIYGGYGSRLFHHRKEFNQVGNILQLLKEKNSSRRAVIQLFDAEDIAQDHKEIPCTSTLQFLIRDNKLNMVTNMRSNDAYIGLPHDIFAFTMLQEIIARSLSVELGDYYHAVGSLHLYQGSKQKAMEYLDEGFQSTSKYMNPMPIGDPWEAIRKLLEMEHRLRKQEQVSIASYELDPYWADLGYLLQIYSVSKDSDGHAQIDSIKNNLSTDIYNTYIQKRLRRKPGENAATRN